jgi:hypothetical protein
LLAYKSAGLCSARHLLVKKGLNIMPTHQMLAWAHQIAAVQPAFFSMAVAVALAQNLTAQILPDQHHERLGNYWPILPP